MHALAGPVDVLTGERGRLTPPKAPAEADHEEGHPAWLERLAGREERPGLPLAEPLQVALAGLLRRLLADEELELGGRVRPAVAESRDVGAGDLGDVMRLREETRKIGLLVSDHRLDPGLTTERG
jgi:hypothetical protein